ncbi:MAG: CBS domain-containing protein [Acidobacteriota bacterium]
MNVDAWMQKVVLTLTEESSLRDAINLSRKHQIRHIPIIRDQKELVGIVSDRDIKRFTPSILSERSAGDHERVLEETPLARIMTKDPQTISPTQTIREAVEVFCKIKVGALPVVTQGKLVGILSETDMLRAFHEALLRAENRKN